MVLKNRPNFKYPDPIYDLLIYKEFYAKRFDKNYAENRKLISFRGRNENKFKII